MHIMKACTSGKATVQESAENSPVQEIMVVKVNTHTHTHTHACTEFHRNLVLISVVLPFITLFSLLISVVRSVLIIDGAMIPRASVH